MELNNYGNVTFNDNDPLTSARYKVIDLETDGLSESSHILQMSIWGLDENLNDAGYRNMYFNIDEEVPEEITKINGITKEALDALGIGYFTDKAEMIKSLLGSSILIAHNAAFEKKLLRYHLNGAVDSNEWICTMLRYTPTLRLPSYSDKALVKNPNLRELAGFVCEKQGITIDTWKEEFDKLADERNAKFHDALFDTFCTARCFQYLQ